MVLKPLSTHTKEYLFNGVVGLLLIIKLWTVQHQDVSLSSAMHDDAWFVYKAEHGYWGTEKYNALEYIKEPGFPLYISLLKQLGIPLRLGLDVSYGLAAFLLGWTIFKISRTIVPPLALVSVILFHPYTLSVFSRTVSGTLYAILSLLWISFLIGILINDNFTGKRWILFWSLTGGLMNITRPEGLWVNSITLLVFAWLIWQLLESTDWRWRNPTFLRNSLVVLLIIWTPNLAIVQTVKWKNQNAVGFNAIADHKEPLYQAALKTLMSIKPEKPKRYTLVQMKTLARVAEHSPAVRDVYEKLSGERGKEWASYSFPGFGPGGNDIGGGHFQWAFRETVGRLGYHETPQKAQEFYGRLKKEVEALFDQGIFEKKMVLSTSIGQVFVPFGKNFWSSFFRVLRTSSGYPLRIDQDRIPTAEINKKSYLKVTNRKGVSYQNQASFYTDRHISGWLFTKSKPIAIESIQVRLLGEIIEEKSEVVERPDVTENLRANGMEYYEDPRIGFLMMQKNPGDFDEIVFNFTDGNRWVAPLDLFLKQEKGFFFDATDEGGIEYTVCVDKNLPLKSPENIAEVNDFLGFYHFLSKWYPRLLTVLFLSAVIYLVVFRKLLHVNEWIALAILVTLTVSRLTLFAIIDQTSFPGDELRYTFPISLSLYILPFAAYAIVSSSIIRKNSAA